jgi:hypothetical protein
VRLAALALVVLSGCASASVQDTHGVRYSAWAIGQGHSAAGKCDRVASDVSESTDGTERRETKDDERGSLCATASGGRGSPGLWATIAAGFGALLTVLAGAL